MKGLILSDQNDFIEKIESLIAGFESSEVEFKSAKGGFPGSFWETYSAFFESLENIAEKVGRNLRYLKNRIIPVMVAKGLLEREYPDTPKHPAQRYRAGKRLR